MLGFFIGLFIGATIGIFLMSILTMGKIADLETIIDSRNFIASD